MGDNFHQVLMDFLTIKFGSGFDKVSIDEILDFIKHNHSVKIDREAFMNLVNLDKLKIVKSVEGDYVYFVNSIPDPIVSSEEMLDRDDSLMKSATTHAISQLDQ